MSVASDTELEDTVIRGQVWGLVLIPEGVMDIARGTCRGAQGAEASLKGRRKASFSMKNK